MEEIVDPQLGNDFDETEMKRVMQTASMCIHHVATTRPHMNRVRLKTILVILVLSKLGCSNYCGFWMQLAQLLRGDDRLAEQTGGPRKVNLDGCDLQDHTSSSYLNDLTRHRQLLME